MTLAVATTTRLPRTMTMTTRPVLVYRRQQLLSHRVRSISLLSPPSLKTTNTMIKQSQRWSSIFNTATLLNSRLINPTITNNNSNILRFFTITSKAQTQQNQQSSEDSITNTSNTGNNKTSEESSSGEEGGADDASGLILTKEAIERLKYLTKKEGKTQYLRVRVDSGGCYGFQYMMDLVDSIESDDVVFDREGAKFVIDEVSLPLIRGATIHWADELIGQSFRIVANPQSSGGCGCGASFELKF